MPRVRKGAETPRPPRQPSAGPEAKPVYGLPIRNAAYCAKLEDHLVTIYAGDRIDQPEKILGVLSFIMPGTAATPGVSATRWKTVVQTVLDDGTLLQQIFARMNTP